jgi:hypothetical protein
MVCGMQFVLVLYSMIVQPSQKVLTFPEIKSALYFFQGYYPYLLLFLLPTLVSICCVIFPSITWLDQGPPYVTQ